MTYETVFWMMLATWAVSLFYPWHPSWPKAKWLVHLPWALIPMWAWYESLMPAGMNIRIDLLLIIGEVGLLFVVNIVRLIMFRTVFRSNDSKQAIVSSHT
jgi:hypothetical protein